MDLVWPAFLADQGTRRKISHQGRDNMMILKMKKEDLSTFLDSIREWGELWGPVKKGDKCTYDKVDSLSQMDLKATRTIIPPKKFLYPPKFTMFDFDEEGYVERLGDVPKRILFGIHPCDLHGVLIMDKLFLEKYSDPYYKERREKTLLLGHSCIPDDKCMCFVTNTDFIAEGFDLFFTDLKMFYLVWVGSTKGHDLVRMRPELFSRELDKNDILNYTEYRKWKNAQYKAQADFTGMPDIFELAYTSPIWDQLADKCLSCGQCSMVCPTCNCYNINDEVELGVLEGTRERFWDSCMFREYSQVAGGGNFRDKRADRLRLWYTHKLQAFIGEFGKPACVGCGRCVSTCPVDINVVTVSNALKELEVGK
jgi:sulfhydrogenase subunit beta (sulfur reductase)